MNKSVLTDAQVGAIYKSEFSSTKFYSTKFGTSYGDGGGIDYVDTYHFSGEAENTKTLLGEFVTESGYATIFNDIAYNLLQAGNSIKEVVFEVETTETIATFQAVTSAGAKVAPFPVTSALGGGITVRIYGTATTGTGVACNGDIRVLKVAV